MKTTKLKIITPSGIYFEEDVEIVTVKTVAGEIGIQPNRLPFISFIMPSFIKIGKAKTAQSKKLWVEGGILYAEKSFVKIIAEKVLEKKDVKAMMEKDQKIKKEKSDFTGAELEIKKNLKGK